VQFFRSGGASVWSVAARRAAARARSMSWPAKRMPVAEMPVPATCKASATQVLQVYAAL
jgi:hypothetical protein